ncbi:MAG: hypothetical protein ABGX16_12040 [Pirellulales bacterium]
MASRLITQIKLVGEMAIFTGLATPQWGHIDSKKLTFRSHSRQ